MPQNEKPIDVRLRVSPPSEAEALKSSLESALGSPVKKISSVGIDGSSFSDLLLQVLPTMLPIVAGMAYAVMKGGRADVVIRKDGVEVRDLGPAGPSKAKRKPMEKKGKSRVGQGKQRPKQAKRKGGASPTARLSKNVR